MDDTLISPPHHQSVVPKILRIVGITGGALLAAYCINRYLAPKIAVRHDLDRWLHMRLGRLKQDISVTKGQLAWFKNELHDLLSTVDTIAIRSQHSHPDLLDAYRIKLEHNFVNLKERAHNVFKLAHSSQLQALHTFYEEFYNRFCNRPSLFRN